MLAVFFIVSITAATVSAELVVTKAAKGIAIDTDNGQIKAAKLKNVI